MFSVYNLFFEKIIICFLTKSSYSTIEGIYLLNIENCTRWIFTIPYSECWSQTLTNPTQPIGKIHPLSKIALTFEPMQWCNFDIFWYLECLFYKGLIISNCLGLPAPKNHMRKSVTESMHDFIKHTGVYRAALALSESANY